MTKLDDQGKEMKDQKSPKENGRRSFLKSVYIAPTILALGTLVKPTKSEAGFGDPPSDAGFGGF